jgi:peptidoglycan/LPS O-acetylase OafA/YrhL
VYLSGGAAVVAGVFSGAKEEIDPLTGARAIAALSIALAHIGVNVDLGVFAMGDLSIVGMPLFFTLSGFVIHYVYNAKFLQGGAAGAFYIARFARIYPLFFAFVLYYLVFSTLSDVGANILSYLTLTFSWYPFLIHGEAPIQRPLGVSWSISTEAFFYIAYACGLWRIAKIRRPAVCFAALVVFCLATLLLMWELIETWDTWEGFLAPLVGMPLKDQDWKNSFSRWLLYVSPYIRIFEFIGGCLTCQLYLLVRDRPNLLKKIPVDALAWMGGLGILGTFALFFVARDFAPGHPWSIFVVYLHLNFLFAPACYVLLFALSVGRSTVGRALSWRPVVLLGVISYSIYLGHTLAPHTQPGHEVGGVLYGVGFTLVIATSTYLLIEAPGRRWGRWILTRAFSRQRALAHAAYRDCGATSRGVVRPQGPPA